MRNPSLNSKVRSVELLKLSDIEVSRDIHSRAEISTQRVYEIASALSEGAMVLPLITFYDGEKYWLADGFHRYHAAKQVSIEELKCQIKMGTQRDAILLAIKANIGQDFRRTNADKRKSVETLLTDPEWRRWSNHEIARRCGVSHTYVRKVRATLNQPQQLSKNSSQPSSNRIAFRRGREYSMDVTRIGHSSD